MIGVGQILNVGGKLIDSLFDNKEEKRAARQKLLELQQQGKLKEAEIQMSAIIAEAKSNDKWTSRARPSFLYVIYIYILAAIPVGILSIFYPDAAVQIGAGMESFLNAIPGELYALFGAGYLGYAGFRSADKRGINKLKQKLKSTIS